MKIKITRVTIVEQDGKRINLHPAKNVENIEVYRQQIKEQFNAKTVLFNLEETNEES